MRSRNAFINQMPWIKVCLVAVTAFGAGVGPTPSVLAQRNREESGANYGWHDNYQEAKALAKKSGLPLMVVIRCIP